MCIHYSFGKQTSFPFAKQYIKCCLKSDCLHLILLGLSSYAEEVIIAIEKGPQSLDPSCSCIGIIIISLLSSNPNIFIIVFLVSASSLLSRVIHSNLVAFTPFGRNGYPMFSPFTVDNLDIVSTCVTF